LRDCPNF
jgi:1-acyl-sn-glycerol-3-phosphate acyltransferase